MIVSSAFKSDMSLWPASAKPLPLPLSLYDITNQTTTPELGTRPRFWVSTPGECNLMRRAQLFIQSFLHDKEARWQFLHIRPCSTTASSNGPILMGTRAEHGVLAAEPPATKSFVWEEPGHSDIFTRTVCMAPLRWEKTPVVSIIPLQATEKKTISIKLTNWHSFPSHWQTAGLWYQKERWALLWT